MQKLIFILLIILLLFLIFNYSKETFQENTTATSLDNDDILSKVGLNNLNAHNLISCTHEENEDSNSPINVGDDEDYSKCFKDETKDKFIEIDKENKKCHIYTSLTCTNDDNKGKLLDNTDFSNKMVFYKKSRELLFILPDAPAEQVNDITKYIAILNGNNSNNIVLINHEHFKGDISTIISSIKTNINNSNHININDIFCCLAEHLFVTRLYTNSTDGKFEISSLKTRISAFNYNQLLKNTLEEIDDSNLTTDYVNIYRKVKGTDVTDANITLAYNYQLLKVLLLMVIANVIREDKYLEKYNSKFITYLYYSFKRGNKIWSAYFTSVLTRLKLGNSYIPFITTHFFNNQNNENIYKLFIYFIGKLTFENLNMFNDTDQEKHLLKFENNVLQPLINIENNRHIFYSDNELRDTTDYCKQANNSKENCDALEKYGCSFNSETGRCHGKYEYENCMQYDNAEKCNKINSCSFDNSNNICKPKDCFTDSQGESVCNVDFNHCNRFSEIQLNDRLQDICFDNVRMVKGGDNSVEINNNFFQQQQGILDKCVDKVYDDNGELKPDNDLKASCVQGCILGNFDNNTKVCVDNTHINSLKFFDGRFCNNIVDKDNCDVVKTCFWEGNKCYPNTSGNDKMECSDFLSEERCPKNSCVWYDERCNSIYNEDSSSSNIPASQSNNSTTTQVSSNFEIKGANCSAINHTNHSDTDKKKECIFNNCNWIEDKKLCVDTINKGCIFKNENDCVNRELNYDSSYLRNRCKIIKDQENDSKKCVDNNLKIPCKFYSVDDCPTDENPKVNFYGEQTEVPYCEINVNGNKCVDKENQISDSCQYNYLKDGGESNDNYSNNCTEVELSIKEGNETRMVSSSFHKERLPCSLLDVDNCLYGENKNRCKIENDECKTNDISKSMYDKIAEISDVSQYNDYSQIVNKVSDIYKKQNQKNMCRYESQILGVVSRFRRNEIHTNSNLDKLTNVNNVIIFFVNVELNDLISVYGESQINKLTEYEKERLVDSINLQARRNIKLFNSMIGGQNHSWKSQKYQISSVNFSDLVKGGKKINLTENFYFDITNNIINSPFNILKNIRLTESEVMNFDVDFIDVPLNKFVKWYVPYAKSNLDECLDDVVLKNLDSNKFFNI